MSSALSVPNQNFPRILDATPSDVRRVMDLAELVGLYAGQLLGAVDLTPRERQTLYDLRRAHRAVAINRSAVGVLFNDIAHRAPIDVATFFGRRMNVELIERGEIATMPEDAAHTAEESSNHVGNLAQLRRKERPRCRSSRLDLTDAMDMQEIASRALSMAVAASR